MNISAVSYLQLFSQLNDIFIYINDNKQVFDDNIIQHLQECKKICIEKLHSEPLIQTLLKEIKQQEETEENQETKETEDPSKGDTELTEHINVLSNIITSTIDPSSTQNMSADSFDNLGSGLAALMRLNEPITNTNLKNKINEIKLPSSNINCNIKRK